MKTTAVIVIVFLSFVKLHAQDQINKGVYSLGGIIDYNSSSDKFSGNEGKNWDVMFAPSGSYFIVDQIELSLGIEYTYSTETWSGNPTNIVKLAGLDLGVRYYIPCGKVAPFIGVRGEENWISNGSSYSSPTTGYFFTGGLEVFIAHNAALEPSIGYEISHQDQFSSNQFSIGIGMKYFIL